jgi:hypothetical protein
MEDQMAGEFNFKKFKPTRDEMLYAKNLLGQIKKVVNQDAFVLAKLEREQDGFSCHIEIHQRGGLTALDSFGLTPFRAIDQLDYALRGVTSIH